MTENDDSIRQDHGAPGLPRRDWLKFVGAAGLGLMGTAHSRASDDLRARAGRDLKLGIMSTVKDLGLLPR
jgi:hypothetical protein